MFTDAFGTWQVESVGQPTGCNSICPHTSCVFVVAIVIVIKPGVRASCRLAHAWFFKIDHVQIVGMCVHVCVCVHARGY